VLGLAIEIVAELVGLVVSDPLSKEKQGGAMQWIDFEVVK